MPVPTKLPSLSFPCKQAHLHRQKVLDYGELDPECLYLPTTSIGISLVWLVGQVLPCLGAGLGHVDCVHF